ncbi:MAG TPA: carboxypeptidase regulatory-like domain-containing protein [Polyangia bacterium]|nr:carboxypeptidase regulatory-like domain-containing protein [Polyangia bacterium]
MNRSRSLGLAPCAHALGVALVALLSHAACTKKEEPVPVPPPPGAPAPGTSGTAAAAGDVKAGVNSIKGTVKLNGTAPEMKVLKREADPFCGRVAMKDEEVIVGPGGGLKNVLVRLTKGVTGSYPPPSTPALIDQTDCMYRPRVQGIIAGQAITIKNSDQTLHNVHTYKGASTIFNQAEIPGMAPMVKQLDAAGQIVKFKCDVHPWMTGYVAVSPHPFFAVTGGDGGFTIASVPAGTYTVEVWHERFGTTTAEVTVSADKPGAVDLALTAR